jgi:hypothetical protein
MGALASRKGLTMARRFAFAAAALLLALFPAAAFAQSAQSPADLCAAALPAPDPATRDFPDGPAQVLQPGVDYRAIFCTGAGPVYVDLFQDAAPETVNNFVFLAQNGYYNNTTFHRVIADFMVQGGDPTGTSLRGICILTAPACSPWPTPGPTPMAASSSSPPCPRRTSIISTRSSAR